MDSGIYLLKSRDIDGNFIYKVGKSKSLSRRLSEYPPNYHAILTFKCEDINEVEKRLIALMNHPSVAEYGLSKCETGKEYFKCDQEIDAMIRYMIDTSIVSPIIRRKLCSYTEPVRLERCKTDEMRDLLLKVIRYGVYGLVFENGQFDDLNLNCNHHWFLIKKEDLLIGWVILLCDYHPDVEGKYHLYAMHIFREFQRKGYGTKVLQILETDYYCKSKYYQASDVIYNAFPDFFKKNGFYKNVKFKDIEKIREMDIDDESLTFRYIEKYDVYLEANKSLKPSEMDPAICNDTVIRCSIRPFGMHRSQVPPVKDINTIKHDEMESFTIVLSEPWIEIMKEGDSDICITIIQGDDYVIRPIKIKWLRSMIDFNSNEDISPEFYGYDHTVFRVKKVCLPKKLWSFIGNTIKE